MTKKTTQIDETLRALLGGQDGMDSATIFELQSAMGSLVDG